MTDQLYPAKYQDDLDAENAARALDNLPPLTMTQYLDALYGEKGVGTFEIPPFPTTPPPKGYHYVQKRDKYGKGYWDLAEGELETVIDPGRTETKAEGNVTYLFTYDREGTLVGKTPVSSGYLDEPAQTFQPPNITTTQNIPGVESWGALPTPSASYDPMESQFGYGGYGALPTPSRSYDPMESQFGYGSPARTVSTTQQYMQTTNPENGHIMAFNPTTRKYDIDTFQIDPNWDITQSIAYKKSQLTQPMSEYERTSLANDAEWRRQQIEADKQARLAQMAANPTSWLEYARLAGETPGVQPWMVPLMSQQYAGTVAGAPLPGYSATAPRMSELPALTNPSVQYWARMGPTAQGQYMGYERARTGALPGETAFRLRSGAPPSGWNQPLQWNR